MQFFVEQLLEILFGIAIDKRLKFEIELMGGGQFIVILQMYLEEQMWV